MEVDFNLSEALTSLPDEYDSFEWDERLDPFDSLSDLTEELAIRTQSVSNPEYWNPLVTLVHCYPNLPPKVKHQLSNLVASSLAHQANQTGIILSNADADLYPTHKKILELYAYLTHTLLFYFGKEEAISKRDDEKAQIKKTNSLIEELLEAIYRLLKLDLSLIFQTSPERNLFVGTAFLKPINALLENPDRVKVPEVKRRCFMVTGLAVKKHGQASHTQNAILQHLTYFTHSSTVMAELLHTIRERFDYSQLTDAVLKDVSEREFNDTDSKGPKSIGLFITKLSELNPKLVMRQMTLIAQLLDSNSFTLRCSVVEVVGNIITSLAHSQEELDEHKEQADSYIELLEERFLDINPYVRSRAIQGLTKLSEMKVKFVNRRLKWSKLAVRHFDDKSGIVRRNAIKLLTSLILNHPYGTMHQEDGSRLQLSVWMDRLAAVDAKLKELQPELFADQNDSDNDDNGLTEHNDQDEEDDTDKMVDNPTENEDAMDVDSDENEEQTSKSANTSKVKSKPADDIASNLMNNMGDPALINKLSLTHRFYKDAVQFVKLIHRAANLSCELLYSKSKNEVVDAMSFFVLCDAYGIENANEGIRRMLHLVWMKGSNEEGNQVVNNLIECYQTLYLNAPDGSSPAFRANHIASNMIKLTYNSSIADLASLEKLLCELYQGQYINDMVIRVLWQYFNKEDGSRKQKRGAIIVLGMLASANNEISLKGLDLILDVGLSPDSTDWVLTRYACVALRRVVPEKTDLTFKISKEDEANERLSSLLLKYSADGEWFSMAEQALNSIYTVSSYPDVIATDVLKAKALSVFSLEKPVKEDNVISLSQLLFLIGHIGLKTTVHLEKCEAEFKKKKIAAENKKNEHESELDMIGGTNEDEFVDAVQVIKEKELLYSENSMLARFIPLVKEIVLKPKEYNDEGLQRQAVLCLSKLMCISPRFCEENLSIYLNIMETATDAIVKSNAVLGLGDMAVCFNNIIDTNKDYLYRGLQDSDTMVQRTCLMTVTFLILAGQVKVKGQLAEMAKLYVNEDKSIVDMCKLFFTELATKDNAIYNGFLDMFSGLSNDQTLPRKSFKEIIRFVVPFVDKDRHKQQLVSKLYQRLQKIDSEEKWNDIVYVIRELIPKQDSTAASRKDKESAKTKLYDEILNTIEEGFKRPEQVE